jgi:hypothetical protein
MKNKTNKPTGAAERDRERNDALNKTVHDDKKNKLPGEYPAEEDIMNRLNTQRVSLDVENFSRAIGVENFNKPDEPLTTERNAILAPPMEPADDFDGLNDPEAQHPQAMEKPVPKNISPDDIGEFATGNESDVTQDDLEALGPKDLSLDMGEDEDILKNRVWPVDMAGEDLDIPGSEASGDNGANAGGEDEENEFYSLGGDAHEDNLEGK